MADANVQPVELPRADEPQTPRLPTAATLRQMILDLDNAAAQSVQVSIPTPQPAPFPGPVTLPGLPGAGAGSAPGLRPSMVGDPTGRR